MTLQYKLDNEFELIFVVAFQKILQLSYIDKFLSDIHLEFRDKYKNDLRSENRNFLQYEFGDCYLRLLQEAEEWGRLQAKLPKQMRSFEESQKSKKTVSSMVEKRGGDDKQPKKSVKILETKKEEVKVLAQQNGNSPNEDILSAREKFIAKQQGKGVKKVKVEKA